MCFDVAPSAYRSIHTKPIFRFFDLFPIARQAFFAIGYRPRPQEPAIDGPQPSWANFHAS